MEQRESSFARRVVTLSRGVGSETREGTGTVVRFVRGCQRVWQGRVYGRSAGKEEFETVPRIFEEIKCDVEALRIGARDSRR